MINGCDLFMFVTQIPKHEPVVINLGEDSDDSETDSKSEVKIGFLGSLDQLLKEARKASEVRTIYHLYHPGMPSWPSRI